MSIANIVNKWISDGLKPYNFKSTEVELTGLSEIGDGYVGDIAFAKVYALKSDGTKEELNIVVKYSKSNPEQRKQFPVAALFQTEIFIYSTLMPIYKHLEKDAKLDVLDKFLPKCFSTYEYETQEILLLENLQVGFEIHDRMTPLDFDHLKMTYGNYGVWHAFSLAYREKYPNKFQKAKDELKTHLGALKHLFEPLFLCSEENVYAILDEAGEAQIAAELKKSISTSFSKKILDHMDTTEANGVIVHGDGWNNNFMFKYKGHNQSHPEGGKLIDFQLAHVDSPVFDLSYHIYATASQTALDEFPALIRVYHDSLSFCLKRLGFDPEKIFSFSELERQWKCYSIAGLIWGTMASPFAVCEKEDAVDLASQDEKVFRQMYKQVRTKKFDTIKTRIVPPVQHYVKYRNGF